MGSYNIIFMSRSSLRYRGKVTDQSKPQLITYSEFQLKKLITGKTPQYLEIVSRKKLFRFIFIAEYRFNIEFSSLNLRKKA